MIAVQNLTKRYHGTAAVDGISFRINRGEVVGLLGPNGAGKTTTMKMLTCYMPPTSGTATMDGRDVLAEPLEVRRRLGYLPESVPLYDEMGVYEYLEFIARVRGIPARDRRAAIASIADRCGLKPVISRGISELSKGYRQRVGLAQAMIHDPDVVILDEPTTGLDPNQIVEIRALIRDLGREKTVILSTHILQEVEAVCDRVLIINDGRIVADGTPAQLHREFRGAQKLDLVVADAPLNAVTETMSAIDGVETVTVQDDGTGASSGYDGATEVHLQVIGAADRGDLRRPIFDACVAKGWTLLEMRRRVVSLEDIFRRLTTGQDGENTVTPNTDESP